MSQRKIIFLGDSGTGKSSILQREIHDVFSNEHISTIGLDWLRFSVFLDDQEVTVQCFDTSGQEKFRALIPSYARSALCVIFVYDVSDRNSFMAIPEWVSWCRGYQNNSDKNPYSDAGIYGFNGTNSNNNSPQSGSKNGEEQIENNEKYRAEFHPGVSYLLVGNKIDKEPSAVSSAEGESMANKILADGFIEVSAKTGENVHELLVKAAQQVLIQENARARKNEEVIVIDKEEIERTATNVGERVSNDNSTGKDMNLTDSNIVTEKTKKERKWCCF